MKHLLLLCLLSIIAHTTITAQDGPRKPDIETVIVAYITKKMDLTAAESQEFWPVFNNYRKEHRTTIKETDEIKKSELIVAIQKKYKPQFQTILKSEARANKTFKVHRDLMQRLKQLGENRRPKMPRKERTV